MEETLLAFEQALCLYEGMLIETGGRFGEGKLGGDAYPETCCRLAACCMEAGCRPEALLAVISQLLADFEQETDWRYRGLELRFLYTVQDFVSSFYPSDK